MSSQLPDSPMKRRKAHRTPKEIPRWRTICVPKCTRRQQNSSVFAGLSLADANVGSCKLIKERNLDPNFSESRSVSTAILSEYNCEEKTLGRWQTPAPSQHPSGFLWVRRRSSAVGWEGCHSHYLI